MLKGGRRRHRRRRRYDKSRFVAVKVAEDVLDDLGDDIPDDDSRHSSLDFNMDETSDRVICPKSGLQTKSSIRRILIWKNEIRGKIRSLVVWMHLGTAYKNMQLRTVLIIYLCKTVSNELWLGAWWRVVGSLFVLGAVRKLMG